MENKVHDQSLAFFFIMAGFVFAGLLSLETSTGFGSAMQDEYSQMA